LNCTEDVETYPSSTNSAMRPSNAPDVSMDELTKDPTLDFLEKQFPPPRPMMEIEDLFGLNPVASQDKDLTPLSGGSQGTSRILDSTLSTPVPAPIEWETQEAHSSLSMIDPLNLPRMKIPRSNMDSEEVKVAAGILDSQWNLFMKARSDNNVQLMRAALLQAYTNQLVLLQLVGHENMMKLSQQWSAKDKLDKLEAQLVSQHNSSMIVDQDSATRLCVINPLHSMEAANGHLMNPLDSPMMQATGFSPQDHPLSVRHPPNRPHTTLPPPVNLPPSAPRKASHYPTATQSENTHYIAPHHLGFPYNTHHIPAGHQPHTARNLPQETYRKGMNPLPAEPNQHPQHHRQGSNPKRGRGRNQQRNQDSTLNMMEIGNFFVRAKQGLNAMQQRGRGRRSRRLGRGHHQGQTGNPAAQL
jgi:hypothetical protein